MFRCLPQNLELIILLMQKNVAWVLNLKTRFKVSNVYVIIINVDLNTSLWTFQSQKW
jgi:hypothetical protein